MDSLARRVVCTGIGIVSPLGIGAHKSWKALLESQVGVRQLKEEHSFEGCKSKVAAYVSDEEMKAVVEGPDHQYLVKNMKQLSRATTMAMVAAHEALEDARLLNSDKELHENLRPRCGVAVGQGMVDFQDIYNNADIILGTTESRSRLKRVSPYFMTRALMNMSAGNISIRYKNKGPNHCVSTACATGAHSIGDAFEFVRRGKADVMICGGTEASINPTAVAGFQALRALCTKYNDHPQQASRPFDSSRCGFVMGEGAGILILESLDHALERGLKNNDIYAEVLGYGLSSDSYNLTAPSPDGIGALTAMKSALNDANVLPSAVGHVNAHATSTPIGDDIECNAIEELFLSDEGDRNITVTSYKGHMGHLLGAAGSVETIFAILSCRDAVFPSCVNLDQPLQTSLNRLVFVRKRARWEGYKRILVKNSFGFGGTNASLVISNSRS